MKFAILMPTTFNIDVNSQLYQTKNLTINNIREMQYIEGIHKIYDFNKNNNKRSNDSTSRINAHPFCAAFSMIASIGTNSSK